MPTEHLRALSHSQLTGVQPEMQCIVARKQTSAEPAVVPERKHVGICTYMYEVTRVNECQSARYINAWGWGWGCAQKHLLTHSRRNVTSKYVLQPAAQLLVLQLTGFWPHQGTPHVSMNPWLSLCVERTCRAGRTLEWYSERALQLYSKYAVQRIGNKNAGFAVNTRRKLAVK